MTNHDNLDEIIPVYKVDLEATDQSTSAIVIQTITELTGQEPDELEPLWDSVDPEALDSFVARAEETETPCRLAFEYQGYTVKIDADGELRIAPSEEPLLINA
ncbi:HalOD1 output domain-containing protein [Halopiger xanaduensis]|uniref:Halobacterial output domain-containing protein n=1 Tax=Halopiger xanaduensis (strain DSM 18323 / JCM 14033 / SH-6) TaxID=797210 RepID=F8DC42_HALXS|nr:HalOD1 output domain-containing protein [Halopiger xanaduensis]AEH37155.1 hypothetical protein Halxa_2537 [Halopiger xanaduensis SH-6]